MRKVLKVIKKIAYLTVDGFSIVLDFIKDLLNDKKYEIEDEIEEKKSFLEDNPVVKTILIISGIITFIGSIFSILLIRKRK